MSPLNVRGQRSRSRFVVDYRDVDVLELANLLETRGLRVSGRATGRNRLEWPMGRFAEREGEGEVSVAPPPGVDLLGPRLPAGAAAAAEGRALDLGPFSNHTPQAPVGIGGRVAYRFDGEAIRLDPSEIATKETYVAFEGATAWGDRSQMPFRVTSTNWQESDRLLAGLMTAFGANTMAIPIDGVGRFDGVMLGAFRRPRIEGRFVGDEIRAWGVTLGRSGRRLRPREQLRPRQPRGHPRRLLAHGRERAVLAGLPAPRWRRGDRRPHPGDDRSVDDFLAAFDLEDYDLDGLVSGDFHLYGQYTRPFGFGRLTITQGTAYGEPFAEGAAAMRFEGAGVRLDGLTVLKGGTTVTGAAYVGWNGTYSFNADARGLAVETLAVAAMESGPGFTGFFDFSATGSGTFDQPRFDVKFGVRDLFFGDEGVGEVSGRLSVRDTVLVYELEAASTRLAASGTGRIALTDQMDAELSFRITDTSLDPYLRAFQPQLSPFTSAIASGAVRVVGELYNPDALRVNIEVDDVQLRFFDYGLKNAGGIRLSVDRRVLQVEALRLVGEDTALDLAGSVDLTRQELALTANGAANLAVLQGFLPDVRSSGGAEVAARVSGTAEAPVVSGTALLTEGRLRHFGIPHALEALNGIITFNASGVRLDGLRGRLAGGPVTFGGRIGLSGYVLSEFDVTAVGTEMRPRFPEGMRSLVDAELALRGQVEAPVLSGLVQVKSALWSRPFDTSGGLFDFASGTDAVPAVEGALSEPAAGSVRYDLRLVAPVHAADRERPGQNRGQRRPEPPRDLRSAGRAGPGGHRAGRRALRGAALPRHAREPRFHQSRSAPAILRRRGGNPRAGARSDLPGDAAHGRDHRAAAARVHVGSAAAAARHPDHALQRFHAERRRGAGRAAAAQRARAAPARGARHARAHRHAVGRSRTRGSGDLRRRFVPDHAAPVGPVSAVGAPEREPLRTRHDRQAHLGSDLPHLCTEPLVLHQGRDHPAGVRPERDAGVGAVPERGPHLRARSAQEAHLLMRARALLLIGLLALAGRADAAVEQWLGQTIVDLRVQTVDGAGVDVGILELVETRLGEPLGMEPVRDTIDHLVGLGRYDDVRLSAAPGPDGTGVVLTWVLRPIQRIVRTTTAGGGELASRALRSAVDAGLGEEPPASRAVEFAETVATYYRDHGYRSARVTPALTPTADEGVVTLTLQIDSGPRTTIGSASVVGSPPEGESRVLSRLSLASGRPYDGLDLQERLQAYEADLRGQGRYLAAVRETTTFSDADHTATVEITVDTGPMVRLVYAGDSLPGNELDTLVPVREDDRPTRICSRTAAATSRRTCASAATGRRRRPTIGRCRMENSSSPSR